MKKSLLYTCLTFILSLTLSGQSDRNYVGLSIGASFPTGDFARTEINDSTSGWARTGVMLEATYAYRITHNFGVMAMVSFSSNKFDNIAYKNALEELYPDTTFSVENVRNWSGGGILVGPYIRLPLSTKLSWDFRGLFGLYGGTSPQLIIRSSDKQTGEDYEPFYRQSATAFNYAWMIGTGFKYQLNKYYILIFGDYLSSTLKFNNVTGWDVQGEPYKTEFKQDIRYWSITAGLGYFF